MALTLQDRFSALVDAKLRATIVQKNGVVWNTKYEGTPTAGAVKVPVRDTEVAAAAYSKTNGVSLTNVAGSFVTVTINKDYAVNELIDNYQASAVPDNIVADRLDSAGYSLALQQNADATAELLADGSVMMNGESEDTTALSKTNVYEYFVDARTTMSKNKIPVNGRFALVTPETFALLLKSAEFIKASALGDEVVQSGAVGRIAGFTVFEDVTLEDNNVDFIVGHPDWCCRVEEWQVAPHLQDLSGSGTYIGASAIQGRKIYAHKVTKAAAVLIKKNA